MHDVTSAMTGAWLPDDRLAWIVAGVWILVVCAYGLMRSVGEADQDPIRPSGPLP